MERCALDAAMESVTKNIKSAATERYAMVVAVIERAVKARKCAAEERVPIHSTNPKMVSAPVKNAEENIASLGRASVVH